MVLGHHVAREQAAERAARAGDQHGSVPAERRGFRRGPRLTSRRGPGGRLSGREPDCCGAGGHGASPRPRRGTRRQRRASVTGAADEARRNDLSVPHGHTRLARSDRRRNRGPRAVVEGHLDDDKPAGILRLSRAEQAPGARGYEVVVLTCDDHEQGRREPLVGQPLPQRLEREPGQRPDRLRRRHLGTVRVVVGRAQVQDDRGRRLASDMAGVPGRQILRTGGVGVRRHRQLGRLRCGRLGLDGQPGQCEQGSVDRRVADGGRDGGERPPRQRLDHGDGHSGGGRELDTGPVPVDPPAVDPQSRRRRRSRQGYGPKSLRRGDRDT